MTLALDGFITGVFANGPVAPLYQDSEYVLLPSASLVVRVRDPQGRPVPRATVNVTCAPVREERGDQFWPWLEWKDVTDGDGTVVLAVAANRDLAAVVGARGFITEQVAMRSTDTMDVTLRPSARVRLRVVDDATGRPLIPSAELHRREPAPGGWVGSSECVEGSILFDRDVTEGVYSADFRNYGWQRISQPVIVRAELGTIDETVRLRQEEGFGCVSLAVEVGGGIVASVEGKAVHVFRKPRIEGQGAKAGADAWTHTFEDVVDGRLTFGVRAGGRYDLFIVEATHSLIGIVQNVSSNEAEGSVHFQPGAAFFARPSHWGLGARMRELRVVSKDLGTLPNWSLEERSASHGELSDVKIGQRFGPYPRDAVVTVTCADGSSFSVSVDEAAK